MIGTKTRKIKLPHEPGAWIEVKDLTWKQIAEAKRLNMLDMMKSMKDFGDILEAVMGKKPDPNVKETIESYDIDYVLKSAVKGWSYNEKFTPKLIDQLDPKTVNFLANELLGIEVEGEKVKG